MIANVAFDELWRYTLSPQEEENGTEYARLLHLDILLTDAMGGPLAEQSEANLERIYDVLDIGCGYGGWAIQVARCYPEMQVHGIDINASYIQSAQAIARLQGLDNVSFDVMDATRPLAFADASFDLINIRLLGSFFLPLQWSSLFMECYRLLRSGGVLKVTEGEWGLVTQTSPAFARLFALSLQAMHQEGRSFSPDGRFQALTPMLLHLFRETHFCRVQCVSSAIDHSFGTEGHSAIVAEYVLFFQLYMPRILHHQLATQEDIEVLLAQATQEMQAPQFTALLYLLTAWGEKPPDIHTTVPRQMKIAQALPVERSSKEKANACQACLCH